MGQAWLCGALRPQHGASLRRRGSPQPGACLPVSGGGAVGHVAVFTSVGARRPRPCPPLVGPVIRGTRPHCVRARDAQARGRREGRGEAKWVFGTSPSPRYPHSVRVFPLLSPSGPVMSPRLWTLSPARSCSSALLFPKWVCRVCGLWIPTLRRSTIVLHFRGTQGV